MLAGTFVYLASRSPRRRELLARIGVRHEVVEADVDEAERPGEPPRQYVARLARAKAEAGWRRLVAKGAPAAPVLGADTTVALAGRIFGKPADRADAMRMLAALSGRRHQVLTAVAVRFVDRIEESLSVSEVEFCEWSAAQIRAYVDSGESDDKAGAYAIQGLAERFVVGLSGSHSGVMGLPLYETARLLERIAEPA